MTYGSKKICGCKETKTPCGCNEPVVCGCPSKTDLLCTFYSGNTLLPLNIEPGTDGNTVIKIINDYIKNFIDTIEIDPTVIESIGGKVAIYKGLSDAFVHQIKSIQGTQGVIVESLNNSSDCANPGDFINVSLDKTWIKNYIIYLFTSGEIDICELIKHCSVIPPDQDPVVTDMTFNIAHKATKVFSATDFTSHYTSPISSALTAIQITGFDLSGYKLNGVNYVSGTEITLFDLQNGALTYTGTNTNSAYTSTVQYKAKDSQNNWSNMANIIFNVAAKIIISLNPVTVPLVRAISNNKTASVSYTNGNGQVLSAGQVLYTVGTAGQPGYLKITVQNNITLSTSGSFGIVVDSLPTATQVNQSVNYVIDDGTGVVNLTYTSNPETTDIIINLANRATHQFANPTNEFATHYSSYDGSPITDVRCLAPVTGLTYAGSPYVAGTWIPISQVNQLTFTGANQNAAYTQTTPWEARDANGNISLI